MSDEFIETENNVEKESDSALRRAANIDPAQIAAKAIMCDICDRRGLKIEFQKMWHEDEKMAEHVQFVWQTIIEKAYAKYSR